ncbi:retrovirus-related pol polyprotein from transposon TNT 1-94 [Tanacetum coccineum]
MHDDLKYVESLENEIDELESDKAEFSNMYDMLLQECVSNDVMCRISKNLLDRDSSSSLDLLTQMGIRLTMLASVLITETSSTRQHVGTSLIHIESCKSPTKEACFDVLAQADFHLHLNTLVSLETNYINSKLSHAKASPTQAGLSHRRLSHLNFDYINLISKKDVMIGLPVLKYVKDQLCSSCEDETPEVLKYFLKMIQRNLQASVIYVRTDRCTEFLNKTLNSFFKEEGIEHQTSTPRTPEQNGVVERRNRTLVEAARTMLSASKLPLFFWAKAIATACYTQNISIIILTHEKIAYHIINDRKASIKHLHIFGCTCYLTRDGENLDKMKEKGDPCILVGYSTQSKGYRVYNKRTRLIVESIHLRFDEIKEMSETSVANDTSGLIAQQQKVSDYDNSDPPHNYKMFLLQQIQHSAQQDTHPSTIIHPTSEPSTPTNVHAEENNNNQADDTEHEFTNPFCKPVQEVVESSSRNIGNSNLHTFNQPQDSEYRWTKDHPLTQVRRDPSKPVQTRRQLATDPEMCMFALTMSTAEPKKG